jgi:hypothetical protein
MPNPLMNKTDVHNKSLPFPSCHPPPFKLATGPCAATLVTLAEKTISTRMNTSPFLSADLIRSDHVISTNTTRVDTANHIKHHSKCVPSGGSQLREISLRWSGSGTVLASGGQHAYDDNDDGIITITVAIILVNLQKRRTTTEINPIT